MANRQMSDFSDFLRTHFTFSNYIHKCIALVVLQKNDKCLWQKSAAVSLWLYPYLPYSSQRFSLVKPIQLYHFKSYGINHAQWTIERKSKKVPFTFVYRLKHMIMNHSRITVNIYEKAQTICPTLRKVNNNVIYCLRKNSKGISVLEFHI